MRRNTMIHTALAAAVVLQLAAPAWAAGPSSFQDVSDPTTAVNADILRLMGVVSGADGNQFLPNHSLTRAQFCAMVINFMGLESEVPKHSTRIIFSDVTASHWALGYVNLAASTTLGGSGSEGSGGSGGSPLLSGVGDGRFLPDQEITCAQAITVIIRLLGYSSKQVGAVWPDGYLNLAQSIGLTKDLTLDANAPLTRTQAAQLFVNALECRDGQGKPYYTSLGTPKENTVLLAVNTQTEDGSSGGAIRTSNGTYLPDTSGVVPTALVGMRGTLVLNPQNEIVTFVPDESTALSVILSGNAQPSYLKASNGTQYTIPSDTPVYTSNSGESKPYSEVYHTLLSGNPITLFTEHGKVVSIYASASAANASTDAVVLTNAVNEATFHKLTGGATGYRIMKHQQVISPSQLQPYDVVTYDGLSNTLFVSDLRLTCVYDQPTPNAKAPTSITVLGHQFPVLESAWSSIANFGVGDTVVLLLTADGKVAGMEAPSHTMRSNAVGLVSGTNKVEMFLPNGGRISLSDGSTSLPQDQVVTISSSKNKLNVSRFGRRTSPGPLQLDTMKLGHLEISPNVQIFEQVSASAQVPVALDDLDILSVPGDKVASYHTNSLGIVDLIILDSVTGDAYTYGRLREESQEESRTIAVENGTGGLGPFATGYVFQNYAFGGVVAQGNSQKVLSIINLQEIPNVSASDLFEVNGRYYITAQGTTYPIASDVECLNGATGSWFKEATGKERLNACKAFSSQLTLYVDPVGHKVRVIVTQ